MSSSQLEDFFINVVKVRFTEGIQFGVQCSSFQRINIACPRSVLKEALERIECQVNKLVL